MAWWWSRTKHFSPLGTKLYFRVNSSRKSSIVLPTNTPPTWPPCHVVASQELTNTCGELLTALFFCTLLLYHFLYQLCTIFLNRPIATYLATLWPKEANQKTVPNSMNTISTPLLPEIETRTRGGWWIVYGNLTREKWVWGTPMWGRLRVRDLTQRAKKVVSDSLGLVDFAIGLVNSVTNLPNGQVNFFEEFKLQKNFEINLLIKTFLGLVEMIFGLVNVSFSLPEWQAVTALLSLVKEVTLSQSKNDKTSKIWYLVFDTTTFAQKLVVEWRRLTRFPAKMTLAHPCTLLSIEKISYS